MRTQEPPSPNSARVDQAITETEKFLFDEYDGDKDGLMTRKEFFQVQRTAMDEGVCGAKRGANVAAHGRTHLCCARQFLWELKADPAHKLNEGQMISCWNAVDVNKNGSITFDEFRTYAARSYLCLVVLAGTRLLTVPSL